MQVNFKFYVKEEEEITFEMQIHTLNLTSSIVIFKIWGNVCKCSFPLSLSQ